MSMTRDLLITIARACAEDDDTTVLTYDFMLRAIAAMADEIDALKAALEAETHNDTANADDDAN